MSLDNMIKQFKNMSELQAFCEAQNKTILDLSKKNQQFTEEIKHLKKLLEGSVPIIKGSSDSGLIKSSDELFSTNDEEAIARMQLRRLQEMSLERELTFEESKKVEIFAKLLFQLENKPKKVVVESRNLNTDQLLSLVESTSNENANE